MRILIVDNNVMPESWGARDLVRFGLEHVGSTVHVRRAPHEDLPRSLDRYDRIVISGSRTPATDDAPWIAKLEESVRHWVDLGKPVLGVCYGHQILNRALGGKQAVRKSATPEFGWTAIEATEKTSLFHGLPQKFYSFSSHFDEVGQLAPGMKATARSERCAIQACELEGRPVFGIQFHPERNAKEGELSLQARKKEKLRVPLLGFGQSEKLFDEKVGRTIFENFFRV